MRGMRFRCVLLVLLTVALLLGGCDDGAPVRSDGAAGGAGRDASGRLSESGGTSDVADGFGPTEDALFGEAVMRGIVRFEGERPKRRAIRIGGDAVCTKAHAAAPIMPPGTRINADNTLPEVFVYVSKGISGTYAAPAEPAVLDQVGCEYTPHVFGAMAGQTVQIRNSDPTAHNVHGLPKRNTAFNISQPARGMTHTHVFNRPEIMVRIKCDIHNWMSAYCGVVAHPFFDTTDDTGAFEIARLPAGRYEIEVWHEIWGRVRQEVEMAAGEEKTIEIVVSRETTK